MMFQKRFWNWGMQRTNDSNETISHEKTKCARSSRFNLGFRGNICLVRARIILNMVDKKHVNCVLGIFLFVGGGGQGQLFNCVRCSNTHSVLGVGADLVLGVGALLV